MIRRAHLHTRGALHSERQAPNLGPRHKEIDRALIDAAERLAEARKILKEIGNGDDQ